MLLKKAVVVAALAAVPLLASVSVEAQDYPAKPVRFVVPFGAGGPADIFARQLAQHLQESLKQTVPGREPPGRRLDHRHQRGREVFGRMATRCW